MRRHFGKLGLAVGSAALALVLAGAVVVRADDRSAVNPSGQQAESLDQMQARMQTMQAQIAQLQRTTDPAERQKLLSAHMQLMQEQMASMRTMGGGMMQMMHGGGMATGGMGMQRDADGGPRSPGLRHQMMEDRVDMLQMMMEQMMEQMQMQSVPNRPGD